MKENDQKNNTPAPEEKLSVAPGVKPFTRYRAIELAVCGAAVIFGLLYLYTEIVSLSLLMPLYCAASPVITARVKFWGPPEERMAMAALGPTPLTEVRSS